MGFFDRIKKIYTKVDKRIGGILPGGAPRAQAPTTARDTIATTQRAQALPKPTKQVNAVFKGPPRPTSLSPPVKPQSTNNNFGPRIKNTRRRTSSTNQIIPEDNQITEPVTEPVTEPTTTQPSNQFTPNQPTNTNAERANIGLLPHTPESLQAEGYEENEIGLYEKDGELFILRNNELIQIANGLGAAGYISPLGIAMGILSQIKNFKNLKIAKTFYKGEKLHSQAGQAYLDGKRIISGTKNLVQSSKIIGAIYKIISGVTKFKTTFYVSTTVGTIAMTAAGINYYGKQKINDNLPDVAQAALIAKERSDDPVFREEMSDIIEDTKMILDEYHKPENQGIWKGLPTNVKGALSTSKTKVDGMYSISVKGDESFEREQFKEKLKEDLKQKVSDGTATPEDVEALNELKTVSEQIADQNILDAAEFDRKQSIIEEAAAAKAAEFDRQQELITESRDEERAKNDAQAEAKAARGNALNSQDNELFKRLNDMTAQEWVNLPEVQEFALNVENQFSLTTDVYQKLQARIATSGGFGGAGGKVEGPSTLNFGLLQTGSEFVSEEKEEEVTAETTTLNDKALELFGVPYDQLTNAQKAVLK